MWWISNSMSDFMTIEKFFFNKSFLADITLKGKFFHFGITMVSFVHQEVMLNDEGFTYEIRVLPS